MGLSFTQLASYRRCPRQYEYCYVKKIPKGISQGEAFGSAVHNTLKRWGEEEIRNAEFGMRNEMKQLEMFAEERTSSGASLTLEALQKIWHENFPFNAFATRVEADAARMRGEELMTFFYDWWSREQRTVIAVEKGFSVEVSKEPFDNAQDRQGAGSKDQLQIANGKSPIVITGRFDRIERTPEGLHVIDFKTGQPRTQAEVDADLQLSIYALATLEDFGELPASLSLLHITEEGVLEIHTARNESQVRDAVKQIGAIHGRIAEKDFVPTPAVEKCRWCPYRGVCDVAAV